MPITIDNNYSNNDHSRIGYGTSSAESVRGSGGSLSMSGRQDGLTPGSTITGEIVEKEGDQVTIRLSNDKTISAKLQGNTNIEVGMKMSFEVARGADNKTALRPLFSNLTNNNTALSALRAAGLPINETTIAMTDRMMSESMPVNRNALAEMFRNVSAHSNVSPESIVQMTKLNMPLTESNVIQFDNYRYFEHRITNDLQSVSEGVADLFKEAVTSAGNITGNESQVFGNLTANRVINDILNLIDTDSLETILPTAADGTEGAASQAASTVPVIDMSVAADAQETAIVQDADPASQSVQTQEAASSETVNTTVPEETVADTAANVIRNTVDGFLSGIRDIFSSDSSAVSAQTGAEPAVYNDNLSLTPSEQLTLSTDLQNILILAGESSDIHEPLDPAQIMKAVKELAAEYPPEVDKIAATELSAYSEETSEASDEGKLINAARSDVDALKAETNEDVKPQILENAAGDGAEAAVTPMTAQQKAAQVKAKISEKLNEFLRSDGFSKLLKDSVKAQMSIKPNDVAENGKIDELYDRIQKTSEKVNEIMQNIGRADSAVAKSAAALSDNVNFMNNLNEFVNYVQLPLKMAGEDANGELYVYTNKKNLADKDGNYSALLHLDMEHLGPMDIYVTMRNHTKVSTNFYLQTEELLSFIEAHIDELTKRLTEKGYDTTMKVTQKEPGKAITPIADEFTKDEAGADTPIVVSRMRFDVRA